MKKHLLSLSIAACVAGLTLAGAANAAVSERAPQHMQVAFAPPATHAATIVAYTGGTNTLRITIGGGSSDAHARAGTTRDVAAPVARGSETSGASRMAVPPSA